MFRNRWLAVCWWLIAANFVIVRLAHVAIAQDTSAGFLNSDFTDWKNDRPAQWTVEIGATNGAAEPVSELRQADDGSLQLSGDATTKAWQSVTQTVAITPGKTYLLNYVARASGLKLDANQFDNCYVGVFVKDAQGQTIKQIVCPIDSASTNGEIQTDQQVVFIPQTAVNADVIVFLSKTGTLNVTRLEWREASPDESFDLLVADMDRNYSFFELRKIDWAKLTEQYRERAMQAKQPIEFANLAAEMLAELKDPHVWLMVEGQTISKFDSTTKPNFDFRLIQAKLKEVKKFGSIALIGRTNDGLGYLAMASLTIESQQQLNELLDAIEGLFDCPGIVIDLRPNGGGAEPVAQAIAGMFTDQKRLYAKHQFRSGPKHSDLGPPQTRELSPTPERSTYLKPIVCLIGPKTMSSGEGMALMFQSMPQCTLIGQPTRGASGNPQPIQLPNGVAVWYSRWVSLSPDGKPIEGVGVVPAVKVKHEDGKERILEKAIEHLSQEIR